ncbi:MAG: saccharopine dehydrogenase C-terminal domain-containing protein [Candidatus Latescibacteria bacterium]|nr:saccharopine dehydrogenase C-terminal domain-containing protein [Candidatus Latescibacterota bacterium]
MRHLLLGAGLQGRAIAWDLLRHAEGVTDLTVVDQDREALVALAGWLDDPRLRTVAGDVTDAVLLAPLLDEAQVCTSAVNYWFNAELTAQAIAHRAHFVDLGGNNDVVADQFARDPQARAAGVTVVPDCGLAPGLAGLLGHHLAVCLDTCDALRLRVGGLPLHPRPPLDYMIVFSVQGLINEYIEPCLVLRDGEERTVPGLSELESLDFPPPFGRLEAFQTSGGASTLTRTLRGRVRDLDYKTIRYPGHRDRILPLHELGLTSSEPLRPAGASGEVRPRDVLATCLERACPKTGPDVVLLRIEADGSAGGRRVRRSLTIVDHEDTATGLTAMMRMTGFPAAITAALLAEGETPAGARPQELAVPAERVLAELARRGIHAPLVETPLD